MFLLRAAKAVIGGAASIATGFLRGLLGGGGGGVGPRFEPIIPRGPVCAVDAAHVVTLMQNAGLEMVSQLASYPPSASSYRRTGTLGRGWTRRVAMEGSNLVVTVSNKTAYAPPVQGFKSASPRQRDLFARRGWPSAETVGRGVWAKYREAIIRTLQGNK